MCCLYKYVAWYNIGIAFWNNYLFQVNLFVRENVFRFFYCIYDTELYLAELYILCDPLIVSNIVKCTPALYIRIAHQNCAPKVCTQGVHHNCVSELRIRIREIRDYLRYLLCSKLFALLIPLAIFIQFILHTTCNVVWIVAISSVSLIFHTWQVITLFRLRLSRNSICTFIDSAKSWTSRETKASFCWQSTNGRETRYHRFLSQPCRKRCVYGVRFTILFLPTRFATRVFSKRWNSFCIVS